MHPRGLKTQWDTIPFLYPPKETLKRYRKDEIDIRQFTEEYLAHLEDVKDLDEFRQWTEESLPDVDDVTVLCFEKTGTFCHRVLLSEWLLDNVPGMTLGHTRQSAKRKLLSICDATST